MQTVTHLSVPAASFKTGADKPSYGSDFYQVFSFKALFLGVCLLLGTAALAQNTYYVTTSGKDGNSGTSWTEAFRTLQKALATAASGDQIWVAEGTYYPDEGVGPIDDETRPNFSFQLKNGVAIYGGFGGDETQLSQRNWQTNVTILSGDYNSGSDNAYAVVQGTGTDSTSVLDGFTITGANCGAYNTNASPTFANCSFFKNRAFGDAAGMTNDNSSPTLTNCSFSQNSVVKGSGGNGAGMANYNSSPKLTNCSFSQNSGDTEGGAIFNQYSSNPVLTNCSFSENSAREGGGIFNSFSNFTLVNCSFRGNSVDYFGGAIYNLYCSPTMINCSFVDNSALWNGGAIYNLSAPSAISSPVFTNCTFTGNTASGGPGSPYSDYGGAMYNKGGSSPILTNCIVWGDTALNGAEIYNDDASNVPVVTFSIVRGGYSGTGNKDQDPLFVDAAAGNLHLHACSPAVDAGSDAANSTATDLDGNGRINHTTIDMGTYEYYGTLFTYYPDADSDTYGATTGQTFFCPAVPPGYVTNNTDCDDDNSAINPSTVWYKDADNDGYSDETTKTQCLQPAGYKLATALTATSGDCNDNDSTLNPTTIWYKDADNDGYSDGTTLTQCSRPAGYKTASELIAISGDCNDNDPAINPAAVEVCGNKVDDNCNGIIDENTCYACQNGTNLITTNITSTTAQVNWNAMANPQQWQLEYKTIAPGSKWIDVLLTGNIRSVKISSLKANQTYNWHIRAKCIGTWTAYSNTVSFKTSGSSSSSIVSSAIAVNNSTFSLNPNPTGGQFVVELNVAHKINANAKIQLINMIGKTVQTENAEINYGSLKKTVNISSALAKGIYVLRIIANDNIYTTTLVYEK